MPDDFSSAPPRGISYHKGQPQGPPLTAPQKEYWKLDVFSVQPPLEKLEGQKKHENLIGNAPKISTTNPESSTSIVNDFYKEAANISVAAKELLSAIRNIFSGDDDATKRRLDRSLKILSDVRRSIEDEAVVDRTFPVILQDSLEKAIRDTEACLGHAEEGELSAAAKKAYDAHCHIDNILSMLI